MCGISRELVELGENFLPGGEGHVSVGKLVFLGENATFRGTEMYFG